MSRKSRINDVKNAAAKAQAAAQRRNRWIMTGVIAAVILALIISAVALGGKSAPAAPEASPTQVPQIIPEATHWVEIDVAGYGVITAELYGNVAPITVDNFVKLAGEGFYDGLTFHRIINDFMIQGGDPMGDGSGGSGVNIKGEFNNNGVYNPILHERGVLSMARNPISMDSASSQFFIMHKASPWLDGDYAAFGRVLTGIEIVDAICAQTPVVDGNGTVLSANQPVINSIRVVDKPAQ